VRILYCASASIFQQSASHSFTQLRTVRTAERANRVTLTTHLFVLRNVFRRVSTLIIRWCRVRLSGGPPIPLAAPSNRLAAELGRAGGCPA
jgi:hypothetical protein